MTSISSARRPRARLVTTWRLLAFAVVILIALAVLFLRSQLLDLLLHAAGNDELSKTYLENLHALDPGNAQLVLQLARTRLSQGRGSEALALIATHLGSLDPALRREALKLRFEILREFATPAALAEAVREALNEPWSRDELRAVAGHAEASRDAALARLVYERIAPHERDPAWLEAAARKALGRGEFRLASEVFFLARRRAEQAGRARALYFEGIRALQSGNLPVEALYAAESELGALANDEGVLLEIVRLALAANRGDIASRYMKQILRMKRDVTTQSGLLYALAWFGALLVPLARAASEPPHGMRPYDARIYGYAYEIFLGNGELESAYLVARSAVAQVPEDAGWRRRLATVAEQSARPGEALGAWRWLAEHTDAEDAWQALLRLAPGMNDDEALVLALRRKAERPGAQAADLRALGAAYERLGRPAEGAQWFEARYRRSGDTIALELAADLAEQMGRPDQAVALNLELLAKTEASVERVLRTATQQVLLGRFADAHALLLAHREHARVEAYDYWELLADLAWSLQEDASAIDALGVITSSARANSADFERLVALLRPRHPREAARIAEAGHARLKRPALLVQAIEILWELRDLATLKRIYASLSREDEARFAQIPYFYVQRGRLRQRDADFAGARSDLQRAIDLAPEDTELRLAMLWMLIETRDRERLRPALIAVGDRGRQSAYWAPLASGWMLLDEPRRALPFYSRLAKAAPRDVLWLSAYADALEQDGQQDAADRVRRHAWAIARSGADSGASGQDQQRHDHERRERYARLALQHAPGDPALAVLRDLLRRDKEAKSAAVNELVLSWLLSTEQHEQAKGWLWVRYARNLSSPAWAEAAIINAEQDAAAADRLLAGKGAQLPRGHRAELARTAGDLRLAQTLAFEAQQARPDHDSLHLQLAEALATSSNRLSGETGFVRRGVVAVRPTTLGARVLLTPRRRLEVQAREDSQASRDESVLRAVPARDRELRFALQEFRERAWIEAGFGAREAFADVGFATLRYYEQWSRRWSTLFSMSRNERTIDSSALAVAGMRDELSLRGLYSFSKTEFVGAQLWRAGYRSQHGVSLGSATGYQLDAGHRLRIEYPDITLRVLAGQLHTRTAGGGDPATATLNPTGETPAPSFFVPGGSSRYGVGAALGEGAREAFTRAVRAYGGVELTHNSLTGAGYNAWVGLRTSVFGLDQLRLHAARGRSVGLSNEAYVEYGIRYEYHFDRL